MNIMDYVPVFLIICGALGVLCALIGWIESTCIEAPEPTNSDTLFRGKKCSNCIYSDISSTQVRRFHGCPIRQACKSPMPLGNAGLIAWRDAVNAAAEKVE